MFSQVRGPLSAANLYIVRRRIHSAPSSSQIAEMRPRRSYLYVPSSSQRMLAKSLQIMSDIIIYDLEDSVAPAEKPAAREGLLKFLSTNNGKPLPESDRIAVRVNSIDTPHFEEDIQAAVKMTHVRTLVLPKIHSPEDLDYVSKLITHSSEPWSPSGSCRARKSPLRIVASIESARSLWNIGGIASWRSKNGAEAGGLLSALLFAAEDFCADTSIIRTPSRLELLHARSQITLAAKAFELEAIDMVCVNYKDEEHLRDECEDGRRLGFTGKQAIHPKQVDIIQRTFVPTEKEILRAAKIVSMMDVSHTNKRGAFGLDTGDGKGGKEMIDAPMLKQAENTIRMARAAGIAIPEI